MYKNNYKTTSLPIASALIASGVSNLDSIEWLDNQAIFYFNHTSELDTIIEKFWQKQLPIDASTYFSAIKFIKSRMYEIRNDGLKTSSFK